MTAFRIRSCECCSVLVELSDSTFTAIGFRLSPKFLCEALTFLMSRPLPSTASISPTILVFVFKPRLIRLVGGAIGSTGSFDLVLRTNLLAFGCGTGSLELDAVDTFIVADFVSLIICISNVDLFFFFEFFGRGTRASLTNDRFTTNDRRLRYTWLSVSGKSSSELDGKRDFGQNLRSRSTCSKYSFSARMIRSFEIFFNQWFPGVTASGHSGDGVLRTRLRRGGVRCSVLLICDSCLDLLALLVDDVEGISLR